MDCLNINSLEHLPEEDTLLLHYTITCTGTWQLSQLYTAYRNVCDTDWTVMYPNDQHPRHTDFPVRVTSQGFAGTFAWNYFGIRGISAENFDQNHSYLTQLTVYNLDCGSTGSSGSTGGNSGTGNTGGGGGGGGTGGGGRRIVYTPGPPAPPGDGRPPNPNPIPRPVLPALPSPGGIRSGPPTPRSPHGPDTGPGVRRDPRGPVTPGPRLPPLPPPIPPRSGDWSGDIFKRRPPLPIIGDRFSNIGAPPFTTEEQLHNGITIDWSPINTVGFNERPNTITSSRSTYYSRDEFEQNYTSGSDFSLDDRYLNESFDDRNNTLFPATIRNQENTNPPKLSTTSPQIKTSEGLSSIQKFYFGKNKPESSGISLFSIPTESFLAGSTITLSLGDQLISQGEKFVASAIFYPQEGQEVVAKLSLYCLLPSGADYLLLETDTKVTNYDSPLVLGGSFNSSLIGTRGHILAIATDSDGLIIGVTSQEIVIVPQELALESKQRTNSDRLPSKLLSFIGSSESSRIELNFDAGESKYLIVSSNSGYSDSSLTALFNSSTDDSYKITVYDISGYADSSIASPLEMLSNPGTGNYLGESSERFVIGDVYSYVESNNVTISNLTKDSPIVRLEIAPFGIADSSAQHGYLYLDGNHSLREASHSTSSVTSSTATITVYMPYAYTNVKLIVNGKTRGQVTSSSASYIKSLGSAGEAVFTNVSIARDEWFSIVKQNREMFNITRDTIYEGQV